MSPAQADGFRWFRVNADNTETLLSTSEEVPIAEIGRYRHEAFNIRGITECTNSMEFEVIASEMATVIDVEVSRIMGIKAANINISGIGNYEYALNNPDGPYQDSAFFTGLSGNAHVIYVRDKNGCGIVEANVDRDITLDDFPKFFTPNNDLANDIWQYSPLEPINDIRLLYIHIYNRFGAFIKQLDPYATGWDGTYNGRPLPESDYWFRAVDNLNNEYKGHFSLKR
jgi:gliding motility-associated-like protein